MGNDGLRIIAEKGRRLIQVGYYQVGPAVVVDVADGETATAMRDLEVKPALDGAVHEATIAAVHEQRRLLAKRSARRVAANVPVADDDVFPPIVVHVDERRAEANVARAEHADAGRIGVMLE